MNEIKVPREIVNDDVVTVSEWNFNTGDKVHSKDIVVLIETSKAIIEVEAGKEGYLKIIEPQGTEVGIGTVIGLVGEQEVQSIALEARENKVMPKELPSEIAENADVKTAFSRKARSLMDENGLPASAFAGLSLVREKDVLDYLRTQRLNEESAEHQDLESQGKGDATASIESGMSADTNGVGLIIDAHLAAADRDKNIMWLVFHYIWRTWFLSNLVRWAPRFVILRLHRWRGVEIGRGCFIDPAAIIETAHAHNIAIGNDVRIAAQAVIMTHIKPPHLLRSKGIMASTVEPVRLEDSCFIGVGAIIMPGVTVGRAAVVASGSVVVGDVPPYSMVAGNPAKVVKHFSPGD